MPDWHRITETVVLGLVLNRTKLFNEWDDRDVLLFFTPISLAVPKTKGPKWFTLFNISPCDSFILVVCPAFGFR